MNKFSTLEIGTVHILALADIGGTTAAPCPTYIFKQYTGEHDNAYRWRCVTLLKPAKGKRTQGRGMLRCLLFVPQTAN